MKRGDMVRIVRPASVFHGTRAPIIQVEERLDGPRYIVEIPRSFEEYGRVLQLALKPEQIR